MREYGVIHTCFWEHPTIAALPIVSKLVATYLMTSKHINMIGCALLPVEYIVADLNINPKEALAALGSLMDVNFIKQDYDYKWVMLPTFLKWNPLLNPNQKKSAAKTFNKIPPYLSFYKELTEILNLYDVKVEGRKSELPETLSKPFGNPFETVSEPFRNPFETNININNNNNNKNTSLTTTVEKKNSARARGKIICKFCNDASCRFPEVVAVYPPKSEIGWASHTAWRQQNLDLRAETIVLDVTDRSLSHKPWRLDGGRYIPNLEVYLKQECWSDPIIRFKTTNLETSADDDYSRQQFSESAKIYTIESAGNAKAGRDHSLSSSASC